MSTRRYALIILVGIALAITSAAVISRGASAQCPGPYDPCPKDDRAKRATETALPTATASPTPTEPATPTAVPAACVTPDADQLAILCANIPAPVGGSTIPDAVDPSPQVPSPPPLSPLLVGALGLGLGVVIGLFLPAVQKGIGGSGGRAGGTHPPDPGFDANYKVQTGATGGPGDVFAKMQDEVAQKVQKVSAAPSEHFTKTEGLGSQKIPSPGPPGSPNEGFGSQKTPAPGPPDSPEIDMKYMK